MESSAKDFQDFLPGALAGAAAQAHASASGTLPVPASYVLGGIVFGLSLLHAIMPSIDEGLALVPHHTIFSPVVYIPIPFFWNVATAHFFEGHLLKAAIIGPWVVALAQMLERLWSVRALSLHVAFTAVLSGLCLFITQVLHVYRTNTHQEFFAPVRGCSGLLVALAVGLRHAYPFEALPLAPRSYGLQCQHLPFALAASITTVGLIAPRLLPEWPFAPLSLFFGWLYLRYFMWFPYAEAHGDHSPDFNFAILFPRPLRPLVSCVGAIVYSCAAAVAPGHTKLREVDTTLGQAIMYDPAKAAEADVGSIGPRLPELNGELFGPGGKALMSKTAQEYDARRAKALALLDENINSLLALGGAKGKSSKRTKSPRAQSPALGASPRPDPSRKVVGGKTPPAEAEVLQDATAEAGGAVDVEMGARGSASPADKQL